MKIIVLGIVQRKVKMAILKKDTIKKQVIDLTGPQGNAFYLLGFAIKHCEDFGYDKDDMLDEMIMSTRIQDMSERERGNDGLTLNEILNSLDIRKWKDSDEKN